MRSNKLILIADDDTDFKEILSTKLLKEGYDIAEAANGQEAVNKAKSLLPDLVVMDIQMPEVNGTEAVLELRKYPETKDIRMVFFSNLLYPWPGVKQDKAQFAKQLGAVTFLSKEDDLAKVVAAIKELLEKKDAPATTEQAKPETPKTPAQAQAEPAPAPEAKPAPEVASAPKPEETQKETPA